MRLFRDAAGRYPAGGLGPDEITAIVRKAITSGRYVADERLPDRASLATEFGVSTPTIDRSLAPLLTQGLIDARPGRYGGLFVKRVAIAHQARADRGHEQLAAAIDRAIDEAFVSGLRRDDIHAIVGERMRDFDQRLRSRRARVLSRIGGFRSGFNDVSVNHDAHLDRP